MVELPDLLTKEIKKAKGGYRTSSIQIIKDLLLSLKSGNVLSEVYESHLIDCLERTLELDDANKGFYLQYGRGEQKKDTLLRDYRAAESMVLTEKSDLSYDERLSVAVDEMNQNFPELPGDKKIVGAAYSEYREVVLINKEIQQKSYP